jgi:hypothetical protein
MEAGGTGKNLLLLQDAVARRYGFRGPFDPALVAQLSDPIKLEFLIALLKEKTRDDMIAEIISDKYPAMFENLFNLHGTVIARSLGAKVPDSGIFKKRTEQQTAPNGLVRVVRLPGGDVIGVTE